MPYLYKTHKLARRRSSEAAVSLSKRRAWFADADEGRDDPDKGTGEGDSKYIPTDLDGAKKIIAALEKRLAERTGEIDKLKSTSTQLNERLAAIEQAQKTKLEQEGNFKELATQRAAELEALKPSAERAAELDKVIRQLNETRIAALPETVRALVPTEYAPEKLMNWLTANESLLRAAPQPEFDMGAGGGKGKASGTDSTAKVTDADRAQAEMAKSQGFDVTPEKIAERRIQMAAAKAAPKEN